MRGLGRKDLSFYFVLVTLMNFVAVNSLKFKGGTRKSVNTIHEYLPHYFPHENTLCVVLAEPDEDDFMPLFNIPVIVYTQDHVLQHCGESSADQDGYVLMISVIEALEEQVVPLLKCFNKTNSKLKTKYILVLDVSKKSIPNNDEIYSSLFHKLWKCFGIINIAILPVNDKNFDTKPPIVSLYDPFLARKKPSPSAFIKRPLTQDVRAFMKDRFRNMNSHRLKAVIYQSPNSKIALKDLDKKQPLGAEQGILFKQILEEKLNFKFDLYESSKKDVNGLSNIEEELSGRADYCINVLFFKAGVDWTKQMQAMSIGLSSDLVFVVPKPKYVESWKYFLYIFQWGVCVGLGVVLLMLSGAALLFQYVQSTEINTLSNNSSGISEVVSVWKAALLVGINRLPTAHSQRLLITMSLILGLIFVTLFSAQLFFLIKEKPRMSPIKTLQELKDTNLPIYTIFPTLAQYLNVFENTTLHKLKDNLKTDKLYEKANFMDPKYLKITDRAVVYADSLVKIAMSLPANKEVLQYFDVLKEPIFKTMVVLYLPIDSIYYEQFNIINHRVISAGLHLKWGEDFGRQAVKQYSASLTSKSTEGSHQTEDEVNKPLTYDDLKLPFYILYIGLFISTLCFLKEFCKMKLLRWLSSRP